MRSSLSNAPATIRDGVASEPLWMRESGLAVPLAVAGIGQFLVLLKLETAHIDIWPTMALHASPTLLLWLGNWWKTLERMGLALLFLLTGCALWAGTTAEITGIIGSCVAIPVLLAGLFPNSRWIEWLRLFSWPALGFMFAGVGLLAGEKKAFLDSNASMMLAFGLLVASWSYIDHRKDWSFRKRRRMSHFTLLPTSLLMSFGSWADHVTHGIRIGSVGYVAFPIALMGIFGFDPLGPGEPQTEQIEDADDHPEKLITEGT